MSLFYNSSLIAKHFNAFITKTIEKKIFFLKKIGKNSRKKKYPGYRAGPGRAGPGRASGLLRAGLQNHNYGFMAYIFRFTPI